MRVSTCIPNISRFNPDLQYCSCLIKNDLQIFCRPHVNQFISYILQGKVKANKSCFQYLVNKKKNIVSCILKSIPPITSKIQSQIWLFKKKKIKILSYLENQFTNWVPAQWIEPTEYSVSTCRQDCPHSITVGDPSQAPYLVKMTLQKSKCNTITLITVEVLSSLKYKKYWSVQYWLISLLELYFRSNSLKYLKVSIITK